MAVFRKAWLAPEPMKKPGVCFGLEIIEKAWDLAHARIRVPCFGLKAAQVWPHMSPGKFIKNISLGRITAPGLPL